MTTYSEELEINNLLSEACFYRNRKEEDDSFIEKSINCIKTADAKIKKNIRESFINLSYDTIINFCEIALTIPNQEVLSEYYVDLFFQRNKSKGQMYIRALLVKAQLIALNGHKQLLKAEEMVQNLQKALSYTNEALDIIKNSDKTKYSFLIYNVSVCVYNIIRFLIKQNWSKYFVEITKNLDALFDEVDEPDYNWRCRYTWVLFQCLYDADNKADAIKVLDKLWENTKKKGPCNFQEQLFRLRVHLCKENAALVNNVKKDVETGPPKAGEEDKGWRFIFTLQMLKSGVIPEAQVEKELVQLINQLNPQVLQNPEGQTSQKLSPMFLERIAESGRVSLQYNLLDLAQNITTFLSKQRQPQQKQYVLQELNKAELLVKKPGNLIDKKSGMKLNMIQQRMQQIERRQDAIRMVEKAMHAIENKNTKTLDPDLVYEASVLIWNLGLPFLNDNQRKEVHKAYQTACSYLEKIQSNDHQLRVQFHLELAKCELAENGIFQASEHIKKASLLDYSIPAVKAKAVNKIDEEEDLGLYQRPLERYVKNLADSINLKQNSNADPQNVIEKVILDLESAQASKKESMKIDILQKSLNNLIHLRENEYQANPKKDLVEEEIQKEKVKHKQNNLYKYKQKKLLTAEIASLAFEWEQDEISKKACLFVIEDTWETKNAEEMIAAQSECYYILAQMAIDKLENENISIPFADIVKIDEDEGEVDEEEVQLKSSQEYKSQILSEKKQIIEYFQKGMKLAESINQSWLVFNCGVYIWNNFLSVFKNPQNDSKLLPELVSLLKEICESMKNQLKESDRKQLIDYDRDNKISVFSDLTIKYAKIMESKGTFDEVVRVSDNLLAFPLPSHIKKLINSIKARVQGAAKGGAPAAKAPAQDKKGGKNVAAQQETGIGIDLVLQEVVQQLETATNSAKGPANQELIKKIYETLNQWKVKENDEAELELHAELWVRLARLALNEENVLMYKYSLKCIQTCLQIIKDNNLQNIPANRLRWYSLAEYIYAENLMRLVNPEAQEQSSQEKLYFHVLQHAVEGANKGFKAQLNSLVLDNAKLVWNTCCKLQDSAINRKAMLKSIFSTIFYLKNCKEKSEPDLILLLSQLLFKGALENEEYKLGENVADMVFELIPKNMQKPIWEAKMIFMSKQGKNELQAISNMKEADASLQSKVWIRLARASNNLYKQFQAYSKAVEILKKENSVEIVEVYIEFAEWYLRNQNQDRNQIINQLLTAADTLINIEIDEDEDEEDEEEENGQNKGGNSTVFSRSTRGKKSVVSKNSKKSVKTSQKAGSKVMHNSNTNKPSTKSVKSRMTMKSSASQKRRNQQNKSKQAKSIFTVREEDSNPEYLNCAHFERLFRIHSMLAMVSLSREEQIQFCLDAKLFLIKILDLSFKTLNTQDEQAAANSQQQQQTQAANKENVGQPSKAKGGKAADVNLQEQQNQPFVPKYVMPETIEDWIKLTFSKEFLEKMKVAEDYNLMCKFLFEKAEITYTYLFFVIKVLENAGLNTHCVALLVFLRFFTKEILNNNYLSLLADLKYAKCLFQLGYTQEADQVFQNCKILKLSDSEKKNFLQKTQASKIILTKKPDTNAQQQQPQEQLVKPYLIAQIPVYEAWIQLSKELYSFGDLVKAKDFLQEALKHTKVLEETRLMGELYTFLGSLYYLEGEYGLSLETHMLAHPCIQDVQLWQISVVETCKTLKKLNKFEDIKTFIDQLIVAYKEATEKPQFSSNIVNICELLSTLYIQLFKVSIKEVKKDYSNEVLKKGFDYLTQARSYFKKSNGITLSQHQELLSTLTKLVIFCEQLNLSDINNVSKCSKIIVKVQQVLLEMDEYIKNVLKYSLLLEKESECQKSPLLNVHIKTRILLSQTYILGGIVKHIKRQHEYKTGQKDQDEDNENQNQMENNSAQLFQMQEPVKTYLLKLQKKIESQLCAIPHRLESFEKAAAILTAVINKIPKEEPEFIYANIELCRAKRLQAEQKKQLKEIWQSNEQDSDEEDEEAQKNQFAFDYKSDSLNTIIQFFENNKEKFDEPTKNNKFFIYYMQKFSFEFLENIGQLESKKAFEYLSKSQHFAYINQLIQSLKLSMRGVHKFVTFPRLLNHTNTQANYQEENTRKQLQQIKLYESVYKIEPYQDLLEKRIPNNSAHVIIQNSPDKRYIYASIFVCGKERAFDCKILRKAMSFEDQNVLKEIIHKFNQIKQTLVKTPIISDKDFDELVSQQEKEYEDVISSLESFFSFFTEQIDDIINKVPPEAVVEETNAQQQKGNKKEPPKKDAKAAPAKKAAGGKDDGVLALYESPLQGSATGIQSLVLLLDTEYFNLPVHQLKVFKQIPALSRDFSLFVLAKRYIKVNFQPPVNNSTGIQRDKLKYIQYAFKKDENEVQCSKFDIENVLLDKAKVIPNMKWEGTSSHNRIASIGEYQKYLNQGSLLFVYGNMPILSLLTPKILIDSIEIANVKCAVILDKINARKNIIDKQSPLDPDGEKTPLLEQFVQANSLLGLLGVSTVVFTQWAVQTKFMPSLVDSFVQQLGEEIYISACLNKFKEPQVVFVDKDGKEIVEVKKDEGKDAKKNKPVTPPTQQDQVKEVIVHKKKLVTDNCLFIGVPVLRLQ